MRFSSFYPARATRLAAALSLALGLFVPVAHAQSSVPLSLGLAVERAMSSDARLATARAQTRAGNERLPQAEAQLRPTISFSASESRNLLDTTRANLLGQPSTTTERYLSGSQVLSLRQGLIRPQARIAVSQAEANVRDNEAQVVIEEQNTVARVTSAYFDALLAQDQLALIEAQKASTRAQLDASRKALAGGSGTRTDVDLAQARLDMALAQELEARQNIDQTRRQLQVFTGLADIGLLAPLDTNRLQAGWQTLPPLDEVVEQALSRNPEIQALTARLEGSRLELDKASAGHYPTLDFVAQVARTKSDTVSSVGTTYYNRTLGLQLNVPIYSGGAISSSERQALALYEAAQSTLDNARRDLGLRVQREYRGVTEGVAKVRAYEQAVASSAVALDSMRKSYSAGVRTVLNVLDAEQELRNSERNLRQARYTQLLSLVRLGALIGEADQRARQIDAWLVK